jgi:hypothetical protein
MEKLKVILIFLMAVITIAISGCSSGNRIGGTSKRCGCGINKGMVGY